MVLWALADRRAEEQELVHFRRLQAAVQANLPALGGSAGRLQGEAPSVAVDEDQLPECLQQQDFRRADLREASTDLVVVCRPETEGNHRVVFVGQNERSSGGLVVLEPLRGVEQRQARRGVRAERQAEPLAAEA